ncbi:hypothetical protein SAOR_01200 [Salinisphaera orenii MK-B5]|uniref:AsmA domain-containing protein n=1 Tax=Salinisphaera orenii MK-B5 TaxID=856730 RepID=A0A423PY04_9GAMM|nr:AsmA family protein [Salinisphaera orenii]ROO30465.1 hypothetical protein SAOR_01200 [Salinisphaera orenii MK-B5]
MKRTPRIAIGALAVLVGLIVVLVVFVSLFDWNLLKPTVNRQVSAAIQRPFEIRGELGLDWSRPESPSGWRGWIPWPHVYAGDVVVGNPDHVEADHMAHVQRVDVWLAPLGLLSRRVSIQRIAVHRPDAGLVRLADGRDNWTFDLGSDESASDPEDTEPSSWTVVIDELVFDEGTVTYDDAVLDADFTVTIDPLGKPVPFAQIAGGDGDGDPAAGDYVFGVRVEGRYKGAPLSGTGRMGGMLALRGGDRPFPIQADVRSGSTRVQVAGALVRPLDLGGADLDVSFSGESLDNLERLTGVTLPATPAYATDGHLSARFDTVKGSRFSYRDFNGRIGDSDIRGTLVYTQAAPRPKLSGELVSNRLRFSDLAPLIGADSNAHKADRGEDTRQPAGRVLPVERFDTEAWSRMDADVRFTAKSIQHGDTLPLSDIHAHLVLDDGELLIDPLRFGVAGGELNTTLRLTGRTDPMVGRVDMHARRLRLDEIMPAVEALEGSLGQINGDATLSGSGDSVADLLADSNGRLTVLLDRGWISRNLMELAGLNVGNYVVGELFGDEPVRINCAAADLIVDDGRVRPTVFVFDTENAVINVTGTTHFADESLDLKIAPESKGARLLTLRSPLYVRGTYADPAPGVEAAPLVARAAAAIALGAVATPAAALLALVSPTAADENQCAPVLQRLQARDDS